MAINTRAKRHSALGQRFARLPFGRRFAQPKPDGAINQADRQTVGFAYGGILAGEPSVAPTTSRPFYRPSSVNVSGNQRLAANPVADVRPFATDDQVQ